MAATIFLIPTVLAEGETNCLPADLLATVKKCSILFVENERTTRRYLKLLSKEINIDAFEWFNMKEVNKEISAAFRSAVQKEKTIGILSEAGCPGIADPGQELVKIAQEMNADVKPLVGPNSIILALMASGMNGQQFRFAGYLPIDAAERTRVIKQLEAESREKNCTQIFIETPYRNDQLLAVLLKACHPQTSVCIAVDLTSPTEMIKTKTVREWKLEIPRLHKRPAIFLLYGKK